jgi:glycerol-1-phosphate dehydrogenase [NAD(P)+]
MNYSTASDSAPEGILVSDFDGTITRFDFYDLVSRLQKHGTDRIAALFDATGFWGQIRQEPFIRADWVAAFRSAPGVKPGFYMILSERDYTDDLTRIIDQDPRLKGLFV